MFEKLKELYVGNKISVDALSNAVAKGWITQDQAAEIIGQ